MRRLNFGADDSFARLHFSAVLGRADWTRSHWGSPVCLSLNMTLLFKLLFVRVNLQGWDAIEWIIQNAERENAPL